MNSVKQKMYRLRLRQIMLILAIERFGSVIRAAQSLNMSQPAATRMLKEAELNLGVRLFERSGGTTRPTAHGRILCAYGKKIEQQLLCAGDDLDMVTSAQTRMTIGTLTAGAAFILPKTIERLQAVNPRIAFRIVEGKIDSLVHDIRTGEIDFLICRAEEVEKFSDMDFIPLYDEINKPFVRKDHPILNADISEQYIKYKWILPPIGTLSRDTVDRDFRAASLEPPVAAVETYSFFSCEPLLLSTDLIAVMPAQITWRPIVSSHLRSFEFPFEATPWTVGVVSLKAAHRPEAYQLFLSELVKVAGMSA